MIALTGRLDTITEEGDAFTGIVKLELTLNGVEFVDGGRYDLRIALGSWVGVVIGEFASQEEARSGARNDSRLSITAGTDRSGESALTRDAGDLR